VDRGLTDHKFASILPLYRAVRRHVWRAAVGVHRPCARLAASQLDYDTEGQHIPTFCPVASAYLRWRMYWEGMRVPADLFRPPRHIPFGVLGWLCDGAPVRPGTVDIARGSMARTPSVRDGLHPRFRRMVEVVRIPGKCYADTLVASRGGWLWPHLLGSDWSRPPNVSASRIPRNTKAFGLFLRFSGLRGTSAIL
jgi:hypothetical protein